jgi:hypothetical protein
MTLNAELILEINASRPDGKFNIRNEKYPTLFLNYEKQ